MAGKRQKLEVIRRPQTCKVEEEEEEHAAEIGAIYAIPRQEEAEEEDEEDGADEKLDEDEDEEGDDTAQKASSAALSTSLVASPVYPNAVKWSEDNLIAVATSQLITILNPAMIDGPRGFVTASSGHSFVVGTVQHTDTDAPCLLPIRLSKDVRAVVRSMDWSPQGLAPNGGCLLVVCTRDHRVKLYRAPHCEYRCEWIQISDVSEILYGHHLSSGCKPTTQGDTRLGDHFNLVHESNQSSLVGATSKNLAMVRFGSSLASGIQPRCVMDSKCFVNFTNVLAYVSVAWSPAMRVESLTKDSLKITTLTMALLALGAKSGDVSILKCIQPVNYSVETVTTTPAVSLVTIVKAHESWVSALAWTKGCKTMDSGDSSETTGVEEMILATGSSDGSVKLWVGDVGSFTSATTNSDPLMLLRKVVLEDHAPVTSLALMVSVQSFGCIQIAIGKASGSIVVTEAFREEDAEQEVFKVDAHSQTVTGLLWAFDGRCLYSCSQDNSLHAWKLSGGGLLALPFPEDSRRKAKKKVLLPDSVLDGYYGLCLSGGSLALATLRGVSTELLDQMYESRAVKAIAQIFWTGSQQFDIPPLEQIHVIKISNVERSSIQWETNVLAALHCFENTNKKLVLWDITAYFSHLASVMGRNYVNSIILRWLLSLGLLYSDGEDDSIASMKSCKESIINASCRRLQIVFAILKRLFLTEGHDPFTIMDRLSFKNTVESRFESFGNSWRGFALDVEHELRERLVHLTITSVLLGIQDCTSIDDELVDSSGVLCMLQWVAANSSRVSLQLSDDSQILAQILKGAPKAETCSTCEAKVPFVSVAMGVCEVIFFSHRSSAVWLAFKRHGKGEFAWGHLSIDEPITQRQQCSWEGCLVSLDLGTQFRVISPQPAVIWVHFKVMTCNVRRAISSRPRRWISPCKCDVVVF
ncbi:hypothetical protein GOP47_0002789 [Adiantum capillus-veneris]|uniref:Transcription factor IIIC 90kDa subunit N-terminal domain-containing protein n=1 Tax=Adiantum capillus-veneris TaxID=13818 RepID=A0A9D4VCA0_ADICA|nr:hypothetical protein GOP47_0002789 [Adiantum capillus-veneris]